MPRPDRRVRAGDASRDRCGRGGTRRSTIQPQPPRHRATPPAARSRAAPPSRWRSGRGHHRSPRRRGSRAAARHRRARTGAAGPQDCCGPAPGWTAGHRPPPCASAPRRAAYQRSSSSCSPAATPVASSRRPVNRTSAMLRSEGLIPRSLPASNGMLSWRETAGGSAGVGRLFILLPLDDGRIVQSRELRLKPPSISW